MNEPEANHSTDPQTELRVSIFGIGDAGVRALSGMTGSNRWQAKLIGINSTKRPESLAEEIQYISLGETKANRLTLNEDSQQFQRLSEDASLAIRENLEATELVFIVTGLGRGTGSGISPIVARICREFNLPTFCIAGLPFDFEGSQRKRVAANAAQLLKASSSGVVLLPNQEMNKLDAVEMPEPTVLFKATQAKFVGIVRFAEQVIAGENFPEIGFRDLNHVLSGHHCQTQFVQVKASGEDRADEIMTALLNEPITNEGDALTRADNVLVHLDGDKGLRMAEINAVMSRIGSLCKNVDVVFGATRSPEDKDGLTLTVLFSQKMVASIPAASTTDHGTDHEETAQAFKAHLTPDLDARPGNPFVPPAPTELSTKEREELLKQQGTDAKLKQTDLPLEVVSRGRFEKSERTLYNGEDLDIPTFVRKGIKV